MICNDCDENYLSYCSVGSSYENPPNYSGYYEENALAGSYNFKVLEIEVYRVY